MALVGPALRHGAGLTEAASAPPPYGFNQPLYLPQFVGTALLIGVILFLNWTKLRTPPVIVNTEKAA